MVMAVQKSVPAIPKLSILECLIILDVLGKRMPGYIHLTNAPKPET